MKTVRHLLAPALLALALTGPASASDKTVPESDFNAYKELAQVKLDAAKENLQKDIQANDSKLDQINGRFDDINLHITAFGIVIGAVTLLAGIAGFMTFSGRAKSEARQTAEDWFGEKEKSLLLRLSDFQRKIEALEAQITNKAAVHEAAMQSAENRTLQAAERRIAAMQLDLSSPKPETPDADRADSEALTTEAEQIRHKPEVAYTYQDWNIRAFAAYDAGKKSDASYLLRQASEASDATPLTASIALYNAGVSATEDERDEDGIVAYDLVNSRFGSDTSPAVREQVAKALFNKGNAQLRIRHDDEAIATFENIEARYTADPSPAIREQVAKALVNRGHAVGQLGRTTEAISIYDLVDTRYCSDSPTELREQVAMALFNKGNVMTRLDRHAEAVAAYGLVDTRYAGDTSPAMRTQVANALINRGNALGELGRTDEAISTYNLIDIRYADDPIPALRELVATAFVNKGVKLGELGRADDEIATYDLVEARYADADAPALREQVAMALFNKGLALGQLGRTDEAIAALELVEVRYANDTAPALREQVATALAIKGVALGQLGRTHEAITVYELVDARYANDTAPAVREQVAKALFNRGNALGQLERTDEAIAAYELVEARYANDETPALRKQVAYAQTGKGFMLLCRAKAHWATLDQRHADLDLAARLFEQAEADIDDKPMVLGNRAYCAHLRGKPVEVIRPLLKRALKDGGEWLYKATLGDLATHPVPEDAAFRVLLDAVWAEVRGEDPSGAATVVG